MHRQERLEVVLKTGDHCGVITLVAVDDPVGLSSGRLEGGGVTNGPDLGEYFWGGVIGALGPQVAQPVEPAADEPHDRELHETAADMLMTWIVTQSSQPHIR